MKANDKHRHFWAQKIQRFLTIGFTLATRVLAHLKVNQIEMNRQINYQQKGTFCIFHSKPVFFP